MLECIAREIHHASHAFTIYCSAYLNCGLPNQSSYISLRASSLIPRGIQSTLQRAKRVVSYSLGLVVAIGHVNSVLKSQHLLPSTKLTLTD